MKKTLILLFFAIMWQYMRAQESQTVYNFLRLPVSSHAAALGGENVSLIEDDVTLMHHNPALLQTGLHHQATRHPCRTGFSATLHTQSHEKHGQRA